MPSPPPITRPPCSAPRRLAGEPRKKGGGEGEACENLQLCAHFKVWGAEFHHLGGQ